MKIIILFSLLLLFGCKMDSGRPKKRIVKIMESSISKNYKKVLLKDTNGGDWIITISNKELEDYKIGDIYP